MSLLLKYQRSAREEAIRCLIKLGIAAVIILLLLCYLHSKSPGPGVYVISLGIWLIAAIFSLVTNVIPHWKSPKSFEFVITDTWVESSSPHPNFGKNFRVKMDDIVEIREERYARAPTSYFIVLRDETAFQITADYGNPVGRIVSTIQTLKSRPVPKVFMGSLVRRLLAGFLDEVFKWPKTRVLNPHEDMTSSAAGKEKLGDIQSLWMPLEDHELDVLIARARRLSKEGQDAISRDVDLWIAADNSPSCGAEMASNVWEIKKILRKYLARYGG